MAAHSVCLTETEATVQEVSIPEAIIPAVTTPATSIPETEQVFSGKTSVFNHNTIVIDLYFVIIKADRSAPDIVWCAF